MKNKILTYTVKIVRLSIILTCFSSCTIAQQLPLSPYGLPYVNNISLFRKTLLGHPEKEMMSLSNLPGIFLDLRYATKNNFIQKRIYPENTNSTYLRKPAFYALAGVAADLGKQGIGLIVFDAYRPYYVTEQFWLVVKDDRYAADPARGSGHNRGVAIDLTLCDLKSHKPFIMPTEYDNFSDSAHQDFIKLDSTRIKNRTLLRTEMIKFGFVPLSSEWWHFSWPESNQFEILNLDFMQLDSLTKY
jgi:zinc D-Ala-D-Ala dipeptidase